MGTEASLAVDTEASLAMHTQGDRLDNGSITEFGHRVSQFVQMAAPGSPEQVIEHSRSPEPGGGP